MSDPAIQLLRESPQREVISERPPEEVIETLRTAIERPSGDVDGALTGRVDATTFTFTLRARWRSARYPGTLSGVVETAGNGSRVIYGVAISPSIRLLLRVWAALSVVILVVSAFMAVVALVGAEFQSAMFSLWPSAMVVIVWLLWRRIGARACELDEKFRAVVGGQRDRRRTGGSAIRFRTLGEDTRRVDIRPLRDRVDRLQCDAVSCGPFG